MRSNILFRLGACITVLFLVACASQPQSLPPGWVLIPPQDDGITASACAVRSSDYMLDRQMATAMARSALSKQITIRVRAVDKLQSSLSNGAASRSFESATEQVSEEVLSGSKVTRIEQANYDGANHLCLLVSLAGPESRAAFSTIYQATKLNVGPLQEEQLYAEFMKTASDRQS